MDTMEKWVKVVLTIVVIILVWVVIMMTITVIHKMKEPQYCPECGMRIEEANERFNDFP